MEWFNFLIIWFDIRFKFHQFLCRKIPGWAAQIIENLISTKMLSNKRRPLLQRFFFFVIWKFVNPLRFNNRCMTRVVWKKPQFRLINISGLKRNEFVDFNNCRALYAIAVFPSIFAIHWYLPNILPALAWIKWLSNAPECIASCDSQQKQSWLLLQSKLIICSSNIADAVVKFTMSMAVMFFN